MLRNFFVLGILFIFSRCLLAQDAATTKGQRAFDHRIHYYEGTPIRKFSATHSNLTVDGMKLSNSAPSIYEGVLYVGTDANAAIAIAAHTIQTKYELENGGAVEGSPAVTKDNVYVGFKNNLFAAFSRADGKLLWKYETKGPVTTTPLVHDKMVYFTTSNGLCYCLNAETGTFKWKFSVLSKASSPAYEKGATFEKDMVIVGTDRQQVYALNAKNGDQVWMYYGAGGQILISDLRVFATSKEGIIFAIDKLTGHQDWHFTGHLVSGTTDLALANNFLVFRNGNNIIALDSRSGEGFKWQKNLSHPLASEPIIVGNVIYAASLDGKLYAFDLETGNEYSHFDLGFTP